MSDYTKSILFFFFNLSIFSHHSYIEWEKYPDRCEKANEILKKYKDKFTPIPEFQVTYQN